ncbi:hypothetical protein BAUCODRAFT_21787 [Baudoinia panamericana UAMH 10762]|uniref:RNase H type-1 domain-containing protein n=1 Tax=Baudoinia panamericana (strain UAMH 10762) TaxID=717646 RepID=M2MTB6_BAUPA|nr:uncharacterized protein BAUCODRAFT_21787 [Baudoinia panamericana UAMH 10762]EMD00132.1 hypothetical protein BAUCODRAFT_21787 [Baudoinia panamericana UAMH 10762]
MTLRTIRAAHRTGVVDLTRDGLSDEGIEASPQSETKRQRPARSRRPELLVKDLSLADDVEHIDIANIIGHPLPAALKQPIEIHDGGIVPYRPSIRGPQDLYRITCVQGKHGQLDIEVELVDTDGSRQSRHAGCGVALTDGDDWRGEAVPLGVKTPSEAEEHGLMHGLYMMRRYLDTDVEHIVFRTDSSGTLSSLARCMEGEARSEWTNTETVRFRNELFSMYAYLKRKDFQWVKAHHFCDGNAVPDYFAGHASNQSQGGAPSLVPIVCPNDSITLVHLRQAEMLAQGKRLRLTGDEAENPFDVDGATLASAGLRTVRLRLTEGEMDKPFDVDGPITPGAGLRTVPNRLTLKRKRGQDTEDIASPLPAETLEDARSRYFQHLVAPQGRKVGARPRLIEDTALRPTGTRAKGKALEMGSSRRRFQIINRACTPISGTASAVSLCCGAVRPQQCRRDRV